MSSLLQISTEKLARLVGTPKCPTLIDVRIDEDFDIDPRLVPGSARRDYRNVQEWAAGLDSDSAVVICHRGKKLSYGVAAWLRNFGIAADVLEGGFEAWAEGGYPAVPVSAIPERGLSGRTVWVTRARPKIDRIACPWLIRRFVDPRAVFLYVSPSEVETVADGFDATPFDIEAPIPGAIRANFAPSMSWSRNSPFRPNRCCGSPPSSAARIRPASILRRKRPDCSRRLSACRACIPTTSSNSRSACCSMTLFTVGAGMLPTKPITGRRRRRIRE